MRLFSAWSGRAWRADSREQLCQNAFSRHPSVGPFSPLSSRFFSIAAPRREIRDAGSLPGYTRPVYKETHKNSLLSLQWPAPPQNILLVKKENSVETTESLIEAAQSIHQNYPDASIVLEPAAAEEIHDRVGFAVYTPAPADRDSTTIYHRTVDLICTLGGDGTILHASSLFASSERVPPMIPFNMGSLGFLGGWSFAERKRAFRDVYMSGSTVRHSPALPTNLTQTDKDSAVKTRDWTSVPGLTSGSRTARVLLRQRLQVSLHPQDQQSLSTSTAKSPLLFAMNEVLLHRGRTPHLAILSISINGHFLTDGIADGIIISTPTGSTAYSLSSGGSIVHPAVQAILITPVCPRSLSFRPVVVPASSTIEIRLSASARSSSVELSVDGISGGEVNKHMVVRVQGEDMTGDCAGGVPTVVRGIRSDGQAIEGDRDAHWVGGLTGLLKFNHPFGEDKG